MGSVPSTLGSPCYNPPTEKPTPVRVEVSVRPESCGGTNLAPLVYRDPGFFRPILTSAVSLLGSVVAAPFRFAETLVPLDSPSKGKGSCQRSPIPQPCGSQRTPPPQVVERCGPGPCMGPPVCAPTGPSVSPLPPNAQTQCGPFIPPMLVAGNEEAPCEPQSLLGGIMNLPSRILLRGRFPGSAQNGPTNAQ